MSDDAPKITLPVSPETYAVLGRLAAERSRVSGKRPSIVGLIREAVETHFAIPCPPATIHQRALRHRP